MLKELQIIEAIGGLLPDAAALSDDAYLETDTRRVYTTDLLIEGRHFSLDYFSPEDLGWKAGAVNLSDIAAMGAEPLFLLVSLGLPESVGVDFIRRFYQSLQALTEQFGARIIGGDTVGASTLTINIAAIGQVPAGHAPGLRTQAIPGDVLLTTGFAGLSAVGLRVLQTGAEGYPICKRAHLRPVPKLKEGLALSKRFERYGLMDTSDGLADAALKMAATSGVRMELDAHCLPKHEELRQYACQTGQPPLPLMLYGGEDFELLASIPPLAEDDPLLADFTVIGRVVEGEPGAVLVNEHGEVLETLSLDNTYRHFGGDAAR